MTAAIPSRIPATANARPSRRSDGNLLREDCGHDGRGRERARQAHSRGAHVRAGERDDRRDPCDRDGGDAPAPALRRQRHHHDERDRDQQQDKPVGVGDPLGELQRRLPAAADATAPAGALWSLIGHPWTFGYANGAPAAAPKPPCRRRRDGVGWTHVSSRRDRRPVHGRRGAAGLDRAHAAPAVGGAAAGAHCLPRPRTRLRTPHALRVRPSRRGVDRVGDPRAAGAPGRPQGGDRRRTAHSDRAGRAHRRRRLRHAVPDRAGSRLPGLPLAGGRDGAPHRRALRVRPTQPRNVGEHPGPPRGAPDRRCGHGGAHGGPRRAASREADGAAAAARLGAQHLRAC